MGKKAKPEKIIQLIKIAGKKVAVGDFDFGDNKSESDFKKALKILSSRKIFPQPNYFVNE